MKKDFRIRKLVKKALEVKAVAEQLKEYGSTNLKVHDIFYHVDYSGEMRNIVDDFLEEQLDVFQNDLILNGLEMVHIGRTSSFYVGHEDYNRFIELYDGDYASAIGDGCFTESVNYELFNYLIGQPNCLHATMEDDDYTIDEILDDYKAILKEYDYFIKACNACIDTYKHINSFKENQYQIFKKYLEDNYTQLGYFYNGLCSIPVYQSIFENDNNIMYLWNQGGDKEQFSTSEIKYQLGFSEEDERVIEKQLNTIGNHINIDNIDVREYINIGDARFYFDECMAVGM